jgi:hypothetical protein
VGWLVLNEYSAAISVTPEGVFAKFETDASRLVEQRLLVEAEPNRSRAFTMRTTLVHVIADCDCSLEVVPSAVPGIDLTAGEERYITVNPGAHLIVREPLLHILKEFDLCPTRH